MLVNVVCICKKQRCWPSNMSWCHCIQRVYCSGCHHKISIWLPCIARFLFQSLWFSPVIPVEGDLWHFIGQLSAWLSSEPFLVHRARFYAPSLDSLEKACRVWFILRVFDAKCSTNWSFSSLPWVRWDRDCQCSSNKKWCLKCSKRKKKRHWATQVLLAGAWWAIKAVYMSSWQLSVWWVHYSTRFENASLSMSFSSFTISRLFSIIVECGM